MIHGADVQLLLWREPVTLEVWYVATRRVRARRTVKGC